VIRSGRWKRAIFATLAGCVLALPAAEVLVLAIAGEQPKFPRHVVGAPWGLRINEPGSHYRHKSRDVEVHFAINAQGLRADHDVAYAKPPGTRRVVCLGDSFTIGYEVEEAECFARVLESELRQRGRSVEVLNAGVSGFSNAEECLYLERELYRYAPDVVCLSFFVNDLADNVRTGLFALSDGKLVEAAPDYVPAGRLGNFLNTNWFFNVLSERSNAFAFLKEAWTKRIKQGMVEENRPAPATAASGTPTSAAATPAAPAPADPAEYERRLCAAILERMYVWTRERGIAFVIQSIPFPSDTAPGKLDDLFPHERFDVTRPGIVFFAAKDALEPHAARELLYWQHSHSHWTPLAHRLAGQGLAESISRAGVLD